MDAARASVNVSLSPSLLSRLAAKVGAPRGLTVHKNVDFSHVGLSLPGEIEARVSDGLANAQAEAAEEVQACRFRPQPHVLISLRLRGNPFGDMGAKATAQALLLRSPLTLRVLNLAGVGTGDSGLAELAKALGGQGIQIVSLDLSDNRLSGAAGTALGTLCAARKLRLEELRLSRNRLGDEGVQGLSNGLILNGTLRRLFIGHVGTGPTGLRTLAGALRSHPTLGTLDVRGSLLSGATGCAAVGELLMAAQALERFYIGDCALGSDIGHVIRAALAATEPPSPTGAAASTLAMPQLCAEGGRGIATLLTSSRTSLLAEVWLGSNGLSDDSARDIAAALLHIACASLRRLHLERNEITLWGATALLKAAAAAGRLRELHLEANALADGDCIALHEQLRDDTAHLAAASGARSPAGPHDRTDQLLGASPRDPADSQLPSVVRLVLRDPRIAASPRTPMAADGDGGEAELEGEDGGGWRHPLARAILPNRGIHRSRWERSHATAHRRTAAPAAAAVVDGGQHAVTEVAPPPPAVPADEPITDPTLDDDTVDAVGAAPAEEEAPVPAVDTYALAEAEAEAAVAELEAAAAAAELEDQDPAAAAPE